MGSHELNKCKVCILCLKKRKALKPLSEKLRDVIRVKYYSDLITRSSGYPSRICINCKVRCSQSSGSTNNDFPHKYKFDNNGVFDTDSDCKYEICAAANGSFG